MISNLFSDSAKLETFVYQVKIMKAEIGYANLGDELKSCIHFVLGLLNGISTFEPGKIHGRRPKRVPSNAREGMPVGDGKPKMLLHGLCAHFFVLVIVLEGKGIVRGFSFERYLADSLKEFFISCCDHDMFVQLLIQIFVQGLFPDLIGFLVFIDIVFGLVGQLHGVGSRCFANAGKVPMGIGCCPCSPHCTSGLHDIDLALGQGGHGLGKDTGPKEIVVARLDGADVHTIVL